MNPNDSMTEATKQIPTPYAPNMMNMNQQPMQPMVQPMVQPTQQTQPIQPIQPMQPMQPMQQMPQMQQMQPMAPYYGNQQGMNNSYYNNNLPQVVIEPNNMNTNNPNVGLLSVANNSQQLQQSQPVSDGQGIMGAFGKSPNVLSWIITIAMWIFLLFTFLSLVGVKILGKNALIPFIIFIILFIINLIECRFSATYKYLTNIYDKQRCNDLINNLKRNQPSIRWIARCYHFEHRRERKIVRDSNGNERTEWKTTKQKIYSWTGEENYIIGSWKDISGSVESQLSDYQLTKIHLFKKFTFKDINSSNHFELKKQEFKQRNFRDKFQDFEEIYHINGFVDRILSESPSSNKPAWISIGFFWLFSFIGFSPCFRTAFGSKCGDTKFVINKEISCV